MMKANFNSPDGADVVSIDQLDPSVFLAMLMLEQAKPAELARVKKQLLEPDGRIQRAFVPALCGTFAAVLGAGIRRVAPGMDGLAIVAAES